MRVKQLKPRACWALPRDLDHRGMRLACNAQGCIGKAQFNRRTFPSVKKS